MDVLPLTIIRQQSLFGIQELYDMEPTQNVKTKELPLLDETGRGSMLCFSFLISINLTNRELCRRNRNNRDCIQTI